MFGTVTLELMKGLWTTVQIFIFTLIFSLPLGLLLGVGSAGKWKILRGVIQVFVWIIRGTPLMLQLIIIFYGPGLWLGHNIWRSTTEAMEFDGILESGKNYRYGSGFCNQLRLLLFCYFPGRY